MKVCAENPAIAYTRNRYENLDNKVMSSLRQQIENGIQKGFSKTPKVDHKTGEPHASNGLNEIDIRV